MTTTTEDALPAIGLLLGIRPDGKFFDRVAINDPFTEAVDMLVRNGVRCFYDPRKKTCVLDTHGDHRMVGEVDGTAIVLPTDGRFNVAMRRPDIDADELRLLERLTGIPAGLPTPA